MINSLRNRFDSANFLVDGHIIKDVKLDFNSVDQKYLLSLGFKVSEKKNGNKYFYEIKLPDNFNIRNIRSSEFNDYFEINRGKRIDDFIISDGNISFSVLGGTFTKSIDEIKKDIKNKELENKKRQIEYKRKKYQEMVIESSLSNILLGSYRKDNIKINEKGGFLPAVFIADNLIESINELEDKGFIITKTEKYPELYDILVPEDFILEEKSYHLNIDGICTFYYKKDLGKIINLDLQNI